MQPGNGIHGRADPEIAFTSLVDGHPRAIGIVAAAEYQGGYAVLPEVGFKGRAVKGAPAGFVDDRLPGPIGWMAPDISRSSSMRMSLPGSRAPAGRRPVDPFSSIRVPASNAPRRQRSASSASGVYMRITWTMGRPAWRKAQHNSPIRGRMVEVPGDFEWTAVKGIVLDIDGDQGGPVIVWDG